MASAVDGDLPKGRAFLVRATGLLLGPLAATAAYFGLPGGESGLSDPARSVAALCILMAVWWMTEALPLAATSLLPLVLLPLFGVTSIGNAAVAYADKVIFLFMGGFMLALAIEKWGLHRRLALLTVRAVGTKQAALVGAFMSATAAISMWLSNTATAAMMLPIGTSLVRLAWERAEPKAESSPASTPFGAAMMLGIAYAASLGGIGTPIGTPPNLILVGYLERQGIQLGFAQWMMFGVPLAIAFTVLAWALLVFVLHPLGGRELPGGRDLIDRRVKELGPVARGEWIALSVFLLAVSSWVARSFLNLWDGAPDWISPLTRSLNALDDSGIAIGAAMLLFVIPVHPSRWEFALDWRTAAQLPWHVLLLFGGGLSLASAVGLSGLDQWLGGQLVGIGALPLIAVVALVCFVVVILSELASNTATAATLLPIVGGVAVAAHFDPLLLTVAATLAASCGFMLPVATPPNAIVFGTGQIRIGQMVRAGIILDVIGIALITATVMTVVRCVL